MAETPRKKISSKSKVSKAVVVPAEQGSSVALPVSVSSASLPAKLDPLARYLQEIMRYPILSAEEQEQAAREYQKSGDKAAAQRLVLSNLRLVVKIAMEYRAAYGNMLDLIQEGNIGLMRAVEKYDPERNVKFSSYAAWWVKAYILKYIIDNHRLVKIGTTQAQKKLFFNLMREKERIEQLGFSATPKLLAESLNVREKDVEEMQTRMGSREAELDAPRLGYDGASNLDFLTDGAESAVDKIEQDELQEMLLKNLEEFTTSLPDKERKIFEQRLISEVPKTLQDIADEYGITRERIRQIEARVVKKMREFFKAKGMNVDIGAPDEKK